MRENTAGEGTSHLTHSEVASGQWHVSKKGLEISKGWGKSKSLNRLNLYAEAQRRIRRIEVKLSRKEPLGIDGVISSEIVSSRKNKAPKVRTRSARR